MNPPVPFPKNYHTYLEKAMQALEVGNTQLATECLEKALSIQVDVDVLYLCVTLLKDRNQLEEALVCVRTYQPMLFESSKVEPIDIELITLLIETERLDQAREQMKQRSLLLENKSEYQQLQTMFEGKFAQVERQKEAEKAAKQQAILLEGKHIEDQSTLQQLHFVKQLPELQTKDLLPLSKRLLIGPLHPLLKTEIIHLLLERGVKEWIPITKKSYQKEIDFSALMPLEYSSFFQEGLEKLSQTETFFLHCAYFYPFEREAFHSIEEWERDTSEETLLNDTSELSQNIRTVEADLDLLTHL